MSKKRIILSSVLLLLVGGFLLTQISGKEQPKSSNNSNAANRQAQIKDLKQAGADIAFSNKIIIGKSETAEELSAIKAQCAKAQSFAKKAATLMSPDQELKDLKSKGNMLSKGCANYAKSSDIVAANTKFEDKRTALLSPAGTDICDNAEGCLAPENFAEYKRLFQEVIELSKQASQSLSQECTFPELKKICDITAGYFTKKLVLDMAYDKSLNGTDNTAESAAYNDLKFPKEEICADARQVTGLADITDNCLTRATQAISARYETQIAASLAKL